MEHHKNFPKPFYKFILRDILHYTEEDIRNLSLVDHTYAIHYAAETYIRRDVMFIMSKIYGGKPDDKGDISFTIEHPEIEQWIKEQYEVKQE